MPTPAELGPYPDPQELAKELLGDLTDSPVHTSLPADLEGMLPLHRVKKIGGDDDRITDISRLVVESYADTHDGARDLAAAARARFTRRRARTSVGIMDRATVEVSPHESEYPNSGVRLYTAIYRVHTRRRTGA